MRETHQDQERITRNSQVEFVQLALGNTPSFVFLKAHLPKNMQEEPMELYEALSARKPVSPPSAEQMPVRMELLPAWKQVIVESRQAQTAAELLMLQSKRRIATAERGIVLVRLLRNRLRDSYLGFCSYATSPTRSDLFQEKEHR